MSPNKSYVLDAKSISKSFGAVKASQNVSLNLVPGEIHALIGPNGAGKSTLIQQLAGVIKPDSGEIIFDGQNVSHLNVVQRARLGLGRSFQVSAVVPGYTVLENIVFALHGRKRNGYNFFQNAFSDTELVNEAQHHAQRTNLGERLNIEAANLSHGERRRLELAMALSLRPKVFLLDEPMAGLGNEGTREVTDLLLELKREAPILLVEHDMDAVFELADRITVLVYGEVIAHGTTDQIRSDSKVKSAYLGTETEDES